MYGDQWSLSQGVNVRVRQIRGDEGIRSEVDCEYINSEGVCTNYSFNNPNRFCKHL